MNRLLKIFKQYICCSKVSPIDTNEIIGITYYFKKKVVPFDDKNKINIIISNKKKYVLGIIDPQNDFFPGGSFPIKNANNIINEINILQTLNLPLMFISQDYHPPNHMSFASSQDMYIEPFSSIEFDLKMENGSYRRVKRLLLPDHCIEGTNGALIHSDINIKSEHRIFRKGTMYDVDTLNVFGDKQNYKFEDTGLEEWLKSNKITDIILTGLETDYCIYWTALDAVKKGFTVHLIYKAIIGLDPDTFPTLKEQLIEKGVKFYYSVESFVNYNYNFLF